MREEHARANDAGFLGESLASRPRAVIAAAAKSIPTYAATGTSARLATASIARTT